MRCTRLLASRPMACRELRADGEMRTSLYAGGMTRDLMRSSCDSSVRRWPSAVSYQKPRRFEPRRRHQRARAPRTTPLMTSLTASVGVIESALLDTFFAPPVLVDRVSTDCGSGRVFRPRHNQPATAVGTDLPVLRSRYFGVSAYSKLPSLTTTHAS